MRVYRHHIQTLILRSACLWLAGAIVLTGWAPPASAGDVFPRNQIRFPFEPAAVVEGPASLRFNPAGLGFDQGLGVNFYHTYSDSSTNGDDGLFLGYKGFGLSTEWLGSGDVPDGRSYTIAVATGGNGAFSAGSSYQWRSSDDPVQNKSHFWSHGITWRPSRWLSLAGVIDNYNRMKINGARTDAEFTYSAAVNLLDGRLIIGGDWYQTTSQSLGDGTYRLAAAYEVSDGITAFGDVDEDENYFLGVRFDMTNLFVGSHSYFHTDNGYSGGVAYIGLIEDRRKPVVGHPREVVSLELRGEIPDRKPPRRPFQPTPMTAFEWVNLLDKAAADPMVDGVILTIENPQIGMARSEEIRRALMRLRNAGKTVVAYCDGVVSNREYYIATAADRILVPPVSTLHVLGMRAEVTFYKRLLDKLGITADLEHIGDYKSASDLLTRTEMSEHHREALTALLDDMHAAWLSDIAVARGTSVAQVREWRDHGPFVSEDALAAGLVDGIAYSDELPTVMRETLGGGFARVSQSDFTHRQYDERRWGAKPQVAVVFAEGSITEGHDGSSFLMGQTLGSKTISRAIRQAREEGNVRAIVLRVNSGGGSVFASDDIWREVSRTVGVKPIVVSFGDVAASGGYYIAAVADSIFALPSTVTGSIGVIYGKLVLDSLYDKLGMDKEVLTRGEFADMFDMTDPFDARERELIRSQLERAYNRFVELVAEGRDLTPDSVDAIARGRVWSGASATRLGLVDRDADLWETIQVAARMGGVQPGASVGVRVLPQPGWELFDSNWLGFMMAKGETVPGLQGLKGLLTYAGLFDNGLAYTMPYSFRVW